MPAEPMAAPPDDVSLARLPGRVRIAAGAALLAGTFGVIDVAQLFGLIDRIRGPFAIVPHAMGIEAVGGIVGAGALFRARTWGPWTAVASTGLLWVTSSAWFLFAAANGFFSLFGFFVPCFGLAAMVLTLRARKACNETARARGRLAEQGFELGL